MSNTATAEEIVSQYLDEYEFRYSDGGGYTPQGYEPELLIDFGLGLIKELEDRGFFRVPAEERKNIAIQAMQGLLANPQRSHLDAAELSAAAVSYADALIAALQGEEG